MTVVSLSVCPKRTQTNFTCNRLRRIQLVFEHTKVNRLNVLLTSLPVAREFRCIFILI